MPHKINIIELNKKIYNQVTTHCILNTRKKYAVLVINKILLMIIILSKEQKLMIITCVFIIICCIFIYIKAFKLVMSILKKYLNLYYNFLRI